MRLSILMRNRSSILNQAVLSRVADVTLKARLRGQFAALDFAPPDFANDDDALLTMADPGPGSRVVVTAPDALELTCHLLRRGYRAVTMVRRCERVPAETADIVIIPRLVSLETMAPAIACARRILAPLGSLVIRVDSDGPSTGDVLPLLKQNGFSKIRTRRLGEGALIRGDLPVFGRLSCV
jgi:hypothetical protein